jgi:hypothetical protein
MIGLLKGLGFAVLAVIAAIALTAIAGAVSKVEPKQPFTASKPLSKI